MRELTTIEQKDTSGGFFFAPFIWGSVIGAVAYIAKHKEKPMEPEGFAVATIAGGISTTFGAMGAAGKAISLINTVNTIETIDSIENKG